MTTFGEILFTSISEYKSWALVTSLSLLKLSMIVLYITILQYFGFHGFHSKEAKQVLEWEIGSFDGQIGT